MFSEIGGFNGFLVIVEIIVIVLFLSASGLLPDRVFVWGRRHVVAFGIVWVAALTLEYWAFGSASFVQINDEGELAVPLLIYQTAVHSGGQYAHGLSGGADLLSMAAYNNGLITLEHILFDLLPVWGAIGANKVLGAVVAFVGAYMLARRAAAAAGSRPLVWRLSIPWRIATCWARPCTREWRISSSPWPFIYWYFGWIGDISFSVPSPWPPFTPLAPDQCMPRPPWVSRSVWLG